MYPSSSSTLTNPTQKLRVACGRGFEMIMSTSPDSDFPRRYLDQQCQEKVIPSANLTHRPRGDNLTGISDDLSNLLNFRSRDLVLIKLFPIFYPNLLNSTNPVPALLNNIIQTPPSTIKVPLPGGMWTTPPYSPEQFQCLKFTATL